MTAEVAIINRHAVTLAADSAVTLTVNGAQKVYNSADKLFELSDQDPIGIMIYNNLEFMGLSLELAIKKFREKRTRYLTIPDAALSFFKYLQNELAPDVALQTQHAKRVFRPALQELKDKFLETIKQRFQSQQNQEGIDLPSMFDEATKQQIAAVEAVAVSASLADLTEAQLLEFYTASLNEVIGEIFGGFPLTSSQKTLVLRLGVLHLHRSVESDFVTGFVIAGFGQDCDFPSLYSFRLDGVVCGKLKLTETQKVETKRGEHTGEIIPFAQREMVDRFLSGIDPDFEEVMENYLEEMIAASCKAISHVALKRQSKDKREEIERATAAALETAVEQWRSKMVPTIKNRLRRDVQDMIMLMPKQELSQLAEAMITITSVKRRFSSGHDSVGGPIDVAVISRMDGFVWVKRKHYFDPHLNPRYFARKFGSLSAQGERP